MLRVECYKRILLWMNQWTTNVTEMDWEEWKENSIKIMLIIVSNAIDIAQNRGVPTIEPFLLAEVLAAHLFAFQIVIDKNLDDTNLG